MVQVEGDNFWPVSDVTSPGSDNAWNSLPSSTGSSPDSYLNDMNGLDRAFFGKSLAVLALRMLIEALTKT